MGDATARSDAPSTSPLRRADDLLGTVTTKILRPFGHDALADLALQRASAAEQAHSVVVVGEVKRGKSMLVNALVGVRDASPVGVTVTTSTSIAVGEADEEQPEGSVSLLFPGHQEQVPHAELRDWVTVDGRHVTDSRREELPTRALVPVSGSRLGDVTVVDTPGVGGLDKSYATMAAASVAQACVLVVVCDATTPLTAPEMAFVKETGAAVEALVVVVTKTDKNVRRWKPIVEKDRALLREHLGRDVPVIGVSSLRALAAAAMPPGPDRDRAEERSGITRLRSLIRGKLENAEVLPAANGLRTALEGLRKIEADLVGKIDAVAHGETVIPDLTREMDTLQALRGQAQQWELHLQRDLTLIRQQASDELDRRLDAIQESWTERINKNGMAVLRRNPQYFTAQMEREFQAAMAAAVTMFLQNLHGRIVDPIFHSAVVWEEIHRSILAALSDRTIKTRQVAKKSQGLLDPSMLTMGVVGSSTLGGIIGVSTMVGIGAVVGVAWVGFNLGFKAMRAGKTNLLQWMRETIGSTKTTTSRMLESAIATARPEIVIRYRTHLRTSIESLQKQIKEAEEAIRTDKETREKTLERHRRNLKVVRQYIARSEDLIGELVGPREAAMAAESARADAGRPAGTLPVAGGLG